MLKQFLPVFLAASILSACQALPETAAHQDATPFYSIDKSAWKASELEQAGTKDKQSWQRFLFDVQVISPLGRSMPLVHKSAIAKRGTARVLFASGSIGHSGNETSTQVGIGLWYNKKLEREQANIFVDVAWPSELGDVPINDLSKARISEARLICEPWAQALAINKFSSHEYRLLKKALQNNYTKNRLVRAEFASPPYKSGDFWVLPVVIHMNAETFDENCLN